MDQRYDIKDFLSVKSAWGASFSPDGKSVAYLSNAPGTSQIFLISAEGGGAEQLTAFPDPVSFVRFSPTEELLIFGKAEGGNERTQFYLLDLDSREIRGVTVRPDVRHDFGAWSPDGQSICFTSNEKNGKDFDAYVMDIDTLEKRSIFEKGEWCFAEGFSPQGTYVVVRQKHSNSWTDSYLCNLKTGAVERLTSPEEHAFHAGAVWLPDESAFFFLQDEGREFTGLARYLVAEKRIEYLLTPEQDVEQVVTDRSSRTVVALLNEDGYKRAEIYDAQTFEPRACNLPPGNIYGATFSENGSHIAFTVGDSRHTPDIWVLSLEASELRRLTHSDQGVPPEAMVEPELIRFESFDGLSIPAFVYRPQKTEESKTPVVIHIHGGPEDQFRPVYHALLQYLVHNGYSVVAPNVRGSSGYGKTYMALDDVEKRLDSVKDIVALRDYLAQTSGMDVSKIVLYGGSYGGFMVLACMAFYPDLWAAGVDIVGIVNFVTFLKNTASYRRALREAEYGSLDRDLELLEEISPINSIEKIKAPVLFIHGANDPRVPLSETEQAVARLRSAGKEVELLVYADEGHGIAKLQNKLDAYPKAVEFMNRVLGES